VIGVDFGGTSIKFAEVTGGTVERELSVSTHSNPSPAAVLDAIAEGVQRLDAKTETIGLAIPGEVDDSGRCWRLPNVPGF
jgi:glucokinase